MTTFSRSETQKEAGPKTREKILSAALRFAVGLLMVALLPAWPYSRDWGYAPSIGLGLTVAILILLRIFRAI